MTLRPSPAVRPLRRHSVSHFWTPDQPQVSANSTVRHLLLVDKLPSLTARIKQVFLRISSRTIE